MVERIKIGTDPETGEEVEDMQILTESELRQLKAKNPGGFEDYLQSLKGLLSEHGEQLPADVYEHKDLVERIAEES